jgi:hypothetical protein
MKTILFLLLYSMMGAVVAEQPPLDQSKFKDMNVDKEFLPLLGAMTVQMDTGGAKVFKRKDGSLWIVSIGVTEVRPVASGELMRRRTVAMAKAQAGAVAELNGAKVTATSVMEDKTVVRVENGKETAESEETLSEKVTTEARGMIRGMPVIGTWTDKDQTLYFLAIGKRIR